MTPAIIQPSALLFAASDGRHRPASHPVLAGGIPANPAAVDRTALAGWRIRALRITRGMSQYDLAGAVGVSRPAVAQWESDLYRPSSEHEARLREVLRP